MIICCNLKYVGSHICRTKMVFTEGETQVCSGGEGENEKPES